MESQARILAFKEVVNMVGGLVPEEESQKWFMAGAALCWAGGCRCINAVKFEENMLQMAASLEEAGGYKDIHERVIDLARLLAEGVPPEAIDRATR